MSRASELRLVLALGSAALILAAACGRGPASDPPPGPVQVGRTIDVGPEGERAPETGLGRNLISL
ncbi:MAG: hypothetical protein ABIF71_02855 [Planctomycetota bacterium]